MATTREARDVTSFVARMGADASRRHGVPDAVARTACSITLRKFAACDAWDTDAARRVQAYYWGVVRRRALAAGSDVAALRERYVAATVAADLREGGYAA
ncbi:MAG: hypothetical protein Q7W16_03795 [Coriobacteriia bacterium]|nr:hypothetical protein [Coriobacteriia bacterium]